MFVAKRLRRYEDLVRELSGHWQSGWLAVTLRKMIVDRWDASLYLKFGGRIMQRCVGIAETYCHNVLRVGGK